MARAAARSKRIPRTHAPEGMTVRDWQLGLRRQYAREQKYRVENLTAAPVFSEFSVFNPASGATYRVAIRGESAGANYCSCPDYAVNTLGTCKHIEAVLARLRRRHRAALRTGQRPAFSEIFVRYGAQRRVCIGAGTGCPETLRRQFAAFSDGDGVLAPAHIKQIDSLIAAARAAGHELRVHDDALAILAEARDAAERNRRLSESYGAGAPRNWRTLLKTALFPYQRAGALFAARAGRAIIADDMGLGKTIQAIAAAELEARELGVERVLVVCPTSLKSQWKSEIAKFSGRSACVVEGGLARRADLYERDPSFFKIVNYDVIHRDLDPIARWSPDLVILDEAQRIKNWQTRAARAVKRINSRYALVLTGTPLENRVDELHSIVEFIDRHRLGPLFAFKDAHEVREEGSTKVIGYRNLGAIQQSLAPILIRRTRKEVLPQLPERMDKNFFVPMTDPQWQYHEENRESVARLVQKWRRYKFLSDADQLRLRICLQNMRMSCDSTYLLDKQTRHGHKIREVEQLFEEVFERPDEKAVVFSQWVRMNELMEEMLERRGWGHVHLHGGVPGPRRKELVQSLHEDDDCRVFLSTDAGGVGLNLQRAATIVNLDLPWNPAVLEQRIARVHRLGQKRPVRVVNFIAEGTIEQGMLGLLSFKRSMFSGILDGEADQVFLGGGAMDRFMNTVERATGSIPAVTAAPEDTDGEDLRAAPPAAAPDGYAADAPAKGAAAIAASSGLVIPVARTPAGEPGIKAAAAAAGPLGDLLTLGARFLAHLSAAIDPAASGGSAGPRAGGGSRTSGGGPAAGGIAITSDPQTGARELRLRLPDDATIAAVAENIMSTIAALRAGPR